MAKKSSRQPRYQLPKTIRKPAVMALAQTINWGQRMTGLPELWKKSRGAGVRGCVIDTGVLANHPDLVGQVIEAKDFTRSRTGPVDFNDHGTHVIGIICGIDNEFGIVGASAGTRILSAKALGDSGSGGGRDIHDAMHWAIDMKADWVSMSLGSPVRDEWIAKAARDVLAAGIPLFAAVGNSGPGPNTDDSPGDLDGVVTVGAFGPDGKVARFSGRGLSLDLLAPGVDIVSTVSNKTLGGYASFSGSSMATPFVAAVYSLALALRLEAGNRPKPAEVLDLLRKATVDVGPAGWDQDNGFGLIDPKKLINAAAPKPEARVMTVDAKGYDQVIINFA